MPNIIKPKKKTKKKINLPTPAKTPKKIKTSPIDYYNCLLTSAQQNWQDPKTGKKKKITACCSDCKLNAPAITSQRTQEIKKLVVSYKQVGDSLAKLLQPIK
jgi:hypothetical protein